MKKIIITFAIIIILILLVDLIIYKNNNEYTKYKKSLDKVIGSNIYEVISVKRSLEIIDKESGLIYYGTNDDLNDADYRKDFAKDFNIERIYYVNLTNDLKNEDLISHFDSEIITDDNIIRSPILLTVKEGILINVTVFDDYNNSKLDKRLMKVLSNYNIGLDGKNN